MGSAVQSVPPRWSLGAILLIGCLSVLMGCGGAGEMAQSSAPETLEQAPQDSSSVADEATSGESGMSGMPGISGDPELAEESEAESPGEASRSTPVRTRSRSIPVVDGPEILVPSSDEITLREGTGKAPNRGALAYSREESRVASSAAPNMDNELQVAAAPGVKRANQNPSSPATTLQAHREPIEGTQSLSLYFATDRLATREVVPSMFRTFLPALGVGCLCWAIFIGMSIAKRFQAYWMLGAALATCLGVTVLHICIIRWQQYTRLANNAATRFSVLRYEPQEGGYPLHLGVAEVTIPDVHEVGKLERPSIMRFEFKESPQKHIMLQSVAVHPDPDEWFSELSGDAKYAPRQEAYVFIHGFNVKFGDALKSTAQLAVDLELEGPVVSYSWPSRGRVTAYAADEASVSWSAPHLEQLLIDIRERTSARAVNVVAHSMGNRALVQSLERLHLRLTHGSGSLLQQRPISSLVMAAPDVDAGEFKDRYLPAIENLSDRCVLYFTNNDRALQLSSRLHDAPRLGLEHVSSDEMQAVHTGAQGLFSLNHTAYGSDVAVLEDMKRVLKFHASPEEREYLSRQSKVGGGTYWTIDRSRYAQRKSAVAR